MRAVALTDFGSTFTKVTLVEDGTGRPLAQHAAPTTVGSDVLDGYDTALAGALRAIEGPVELVAELAASSAGGGLRLLAVGLVAELTAAAGRQAALNAGARVDVVVAGDLTDADRATVTATRPEILLFCGGTDGGQRHKVLANAEVLAPADGLSVVVVACNADVADAVANRFRRPGRLVEVVPNVLPDIDRLDIEPARRAIHEAFIGHVIGGKGLSRGDRFAAMVLLPTPQAVLGAIELFAASAGGGVLVVDVGGATTDVHSVAAAERPAYVTVTGLPPLDVVRTVQGDLGMRWGADTAAAADGPWLRDRLGIDDDRLAAAVRARRDDPAWLPRSDDEAAADDALAISCVTVALQRHCGTLSTVYLPGQGTQFVQEGLDLRDVRLVVGTGGPLVRRPGAAGLIATALGRRGERSLTPRDPRIALDRSYLLAPVGILRHHDLDAAHGLLDHFRRDLDDHRDRV